MTHAQDNPVGNPAVVRLDAAGVARLYDITNEAIEKIKTEMKAQRIADTHGGKILIMMIIMMICLSPTAIGWKTVKEYEMPELAENEDDAKAIRAAVARAKRTKDAWGFGKKRGNGGFGRRRGGGLWSWWLRGLWRSCLRAASPAWSFPCGSSSGAVHAGAAGCERKGRGHGSKGTAARLLQMWAPRPPPGFLPQRAA